LCQAQYGGEYDGGVVIRLSSTVVGRIYPPLHSWIKSALHKRGDNRMKLLALVFGGLAIVGVAIAATCPPIPPSSGCTSASCQLVGTYQAFNLSHFCATVGRCPDYVIDQTFTLPGAVGSDPAVNSPYPVVSTAGLWGGTVAFGNSYASVTAGTWDTEYTKNDNQNIAYAALGHMYAIRTSSESCYSCGWQSPNSINCDAAVNGGNACPSDLAAARSNPSIWVNAWKHRIALMRTNFANAGVAIPKLVFDGPLDPDFDAYWVGDDQVELTGDDLYFGPDANPVTSWASQAGCGTATPPCTAGSRLGHLANFAAAHNKPMLMSEWCDQNQDGYIMGKMGQWFAVANVVGHSYWNSTDAGVSGCPIDFSTAKQNAYVAALGVPYTGGYWPTHLGTIDGRYADVPRSTRLALKTE